MALIFSFNLLEGDITLSIFNMSSLQMLNLAHNKLTGIIPQCFANLSSLQVLDLQMNRFYGSLPINFSKSCKLETLNLNGNQLEGYFPKSLSNCKNLRDLNLHENKLVDKFPNWLQTLQYLKVLVLRDNKLHGPIVNLKIKHPFPSLIVFDISGNSFSGPVPKAYLKSFEAMKKVSQVMNDGSLSYMESILGYHVDNTIGNASYYDSVTVTTKGINMTLVKIPTMFVSIDLSRNNFEGEIPDVIGKLDALKGLNLSHNRLTGHIPQSIGKLTNLESLDLSSNMLTGMIPAESTNLISLEVINFSNNHLVGEIPQGQQFNTFSNDSYEGNLGLCGFPLSKKCGPEEPSPPSANNIWSEEKFGFGWESVAIGYGCGFVIGIGLGYFVFLIGKPRRIVMMFGGQPKQRVSRSTRVRRRTHGSTRN
jgi:Leucine-rich repeat (LRR) protein